MCMKKKRKKRKFKRNKLSWIWKLKRRSRKMPTKEEKQSSSGSGSSGSSGGGGTTTANSTNTTSTSSCSSSEKHKYCLLCNRNDFTLNTFNATIEKDLRTIFNTEVITTALSCALTLLPIVYRNLLLFIIIFIFIFIPIPFTPFTISLCIFYVFLEIIFMFRWIQYVHAHTLLQFLQQLMCLLFSLFLFHFVAHFVGSCSPVWCNHACMPAESNLDQWQNVNVMVCTFQFSLEFLKMSTKCQITDHPTIHSSIYLTRNDQPTAPNWIEPNQQLYTLAIVICSFLLLFVVAYFFYFFFFFFSHNYYFVFILLIRCIFSPSLLLCFFLSFSLFFPFHSLCLLCCRHFVHVIYVPFVYHYYYDSCVFCLVYSTAWLAGWMADWSTEPFFIAM